MSLHYFVNSNVAHLIEIILLLVPKVDDFENNWLACCKRNLNQYHGLLKVTVVCVITETDLLHYLPCWAAIIPMSGQNGLLLLELMSCYLVVAITYDIII